MVVFTFAVPAAMNVLSPEATERLGACSVPVRVTFPVVLNVRAFEIVPPAWNIMFPEVPELVNVPR